MIVRYESGPDAGAPWHYGDPMREQRLLLAGSASVDLSHRPVFSISGPDRFSWLQAITSQDFAGVIPGRLLSAYILNAQGHLTHAFAGVDDGETFLAHTEPGRLPALLAWLERMRFAARVELADRSDEFALILSPVEGPGDAERAGFVTPPSAAPQPPSGRVVPEEGAQRPSRRAIPRFVPRADLDAELGDTRAGLWAAEALRIADGKPRIFLDTDERTIPNELANPDANRLGDSVHLEKGCYPGQETVARIFNLGRPPRRLTLLHLDGSAEALPGLGSTLEADGQPVGRVGTSERHYELGPIALALVKRSVPVEATLLADGIAAAQEVLVDPDAGLHWRPVPGLSRR